MRIRPVKNAARGALLLLLAASCLPAGAQDEPVFRSGVNLVLVDVSVTRNGAPVAGLGPDNFEIKEAGRTQPIEQFALGSADVAMAVVVDFSASMRTRRASVVSGVGTLLARLHASSDEVALLSFNDQPHLRNPLEPVTPETAPGWRTTLLTIPTTGRTAMYDAIAAAKAALAPAAHERKVIVLLSDGADNASAASLDDINRLLQSSNILLYSVGLFEPGEPDTNAGVLRKLAESTGGLAIFDPGAQKLPEVLDRVMEDLRSRYVLAFRSHQPERGSEIRKISVTARDGSGKRLKIRSRNQYRAVSSQEGRSVPPSNTSTDVQSNP